MEKTNLETRLNTLEHQVQEILARLNAPPANEHRQKDWRRSLGMFDNSPIMQEIDEEGRQIRQQDRDRVANDHS